MGVFGQEILISIQVVSSVLSLVAIAFVGHCAMDVLYATCTQARRRPHSKLTLRRALRDHADGHIERAHRTLRVLLRETPGHYDASLAMWEVARDAGYPEQAERAMLQAIRCEVHNGDGKNAVRHWLALGTQGLGEVKAEPKLLVRLGGYLQDENYTPAARSAFQQALDGSNEQETTEVASLVATRAISLDREMAEEAAWQALGSDDLDFTERLGLHAMLERLYPRDVADETLELADSDPS